MYIMYENGIDGITSASEEINGYPKENMLTKYTRQVYKVADNTTTITLPTIGSLTDFAILNTNAESGTMTVSGSTVTTIFEDTTYESDTTLYGTLKVKDGATIRVESGVVVTVEDNIVSYTFDLDFYRNNVLTKDFLLSFSRELSDVSVTLTLNNSGQDLYIGMLYAGISYQYGDTLYGLTDEYRDYSVTNESENGSLNYNYGITRIDKKYPVFCTKQQYDKFRIDYRDKFRGYVLYIGARKGRYKDTYMKYGILKPPSPPKEERGRYIKFDIEVQEG